LVEKSTHALLLLFWRKKPSPSNWMMVNPYKTVGMPLPLAEVVDKEFHMIYS